MRHSRSATPVAVAAATPPDADETANPVAQHAVRERKLSVELRARAGLGPARAAYVPGALFAVTALVLPFLVDTAVSVRTVGLLVALVAGYALAFGIEFKVNAGSAIPTQVAFVPMLVLLPATLVPIAVGTAILVRSGWSATASDCPARQRPFVQLAGGLYTLAPVALLLLTGRVVTVPVLAAAFVAQIAVDAAVNLVRVSVTLGYPLVSLARSLGWTYLADAALTPTALVIAAPAATSPSLAVAAAVGLLGFLALVASDRQRHVVQVTSLADAYRAAADRARRDALTGLGNRLGWDEAVAAVAPGRAAAVIVLDVNDLKTANDSRGHHFGDTVLIEVARTILATLPHADLVARLGGDEFGILLLDDNAVTDDYSALRLRRALSEHAGLDGHPVTAAIGHARATPGRDLAATIEAADKAVYADKPTARISRLTSPSRSAGDANSPITGAYGATSSGAFARLPRTVNGAARAPGAELGPRPAPAPPAVHPAAPR